MPTYGITTVTAPAIEPVSLDEAAHACGLEVGSAYHEFDLKSLIQAAREKVETDTGRALITQTLDFTVDVFPCGLDAIYLPKNPVSSVTSLKYYDTSNVQQTLATTVYKTLLDREPAEIRLKYQQQWPSLYGEQGVITVRFVCGYGAAASSVPECLKWAMKLFMRAEYEQTPMNEDRYHALIARATVGDEFHCYGRTIWQ